MADVKSEQDRSRNMSAIRSKDTKPEIVLRKRLWSKGYRYRKNVKELPGKPDIVISKYKICVFVDSEFFHGKDFESGYHSGKYSSLREQMEHSNHPEFWLNKIQKNMQHDREVEAQLKGMGWKVLRFWSKDVLKHTDQCIKVIDEATEDYRFNMDRE